MPAQNAQPYAAFRLDLEQQQKRAKDLLKAAKAGEPEALRRLQHNPNTPPQPATLKLAQAQHCIARELRFANWAPLKRHITAMEQSRAALGLVYEITRCRSGPAFPARKGRFTRPNDDGSDRLSPDGNLDRATPPASVRFSTHTTGLRR